MDKKEAALQVARLTLLEAERKMKQKQGRSAPGDGCAFDASYGWNRRNAGSYVGARARACVHRGRGPLTRCRCLGAPLAEDERPEGLPPTPSGALTLGLRNFTNELKALAFYLRGDKSEELKGLEDGKVRAAARGSSAAT